jgi:hypothetical protein
MTSQLPFDPDRKEFLRAQLEDLLAQHQSQQVRSVDLIEALLVALLGALGDRPARED